MNEPVGRKVNESQLHWFQRSDREWQNANPEPETVCGMIRGNNTEHKMIASKIAKKTDAHMLPSNPES